MITLTRKPGESIKIGDDMKIAGKKALFPDNLRSLV
ncbi:MAG: carbon storage regulator [Planctomycetota bacterium]|jgi:hypothetical protein